jgi:hypothetical protein
MNQITHDGRRTNWRNIISQCQERLAAVIKYNGISIEISNNIQRCCCQDACGRWLMLSVLFQDPIYLIYYNQ